MSKSVKRYTHKEWKKFNPEIQEALTAKYEIILTDYKTKKEKTLNMLNKVDISTKEGQQSMIKVFDKVEAGFKKVDDVFTQLDNAFEKAGQSISGPTDKDKPKKKQWEFDFES